ncbi:MAG: glycosyltransferase [archaeon]
MILANLSAVITFLFLAVILSYYVLLFLPHRLPKKETTLDTLTIIIPAHNEASRISLCLDAVMAAQWQGKKQVIVIDDGSKDGTSKIVRNYPVLLLKSKHKGKSAAINLALKHAMGKAITIVDADSIIEQHALMILKETLERKGVAAVTGIIKVHNRKTFLGMWLHIEQIYNSLMRSILTKVNANIVTPGPLSMYRKAAIDDIEGFSIHGYSEDIDITVRLIRKGYLVKYAPAVSSTIMPVSCKGFFRQRRRFAMGMLNIFKKHLSIGNKLIDVYTLPLFVFIYLQAVIVGLFTLYQIISGYCTYFLAKGVILNGYVLKFFFEWLSIIGFVKWGMGVFSGTTPLTLVTAVGILASLLSYPLFLYAIIKYDKNIDIFHAIPFFFMFPFWLIIMVIYILMIPTFFKEQRNRWHKE